MQLLEKLILWIMAIAKKIKLHGLNLSMIKS